MNNEHSHTNLSSVNHRVEKEKITIPLLEERLLIENKKHKIGEVIIRKEIETQIVPVSVRREKLIIEQVSPEYQKLAEIDLINKETTEFISLEKDLIVNGEFTSAKVASLLLNAIAQEENHGCQQIKVTVVVENEYQQQKYQEWFNHCSNSASTSSS
ncbi:DUF2382 domain-containing protein [Okeanomitos corallinicola TIOX110]|uniref:DUF2382 domain-containing protein n=1 Tax=Okeanomitos corallinicola TIOX110 TaxID=3133117 RepID=A0ABZ2US51_9CYAN